MSQNNKNINGNEASHQPVEKREGVILTFLSGLLAGSERFIDKTNFLVGSSTDADIILLDDGIAPVHFAVGITRSMLGMNITLQAMADGVSLQGKMLQNQEIFNVQKIANIIIDGIELRIQDAKGFQYNIITSPEPDEEVVSEEDNGIVIEHSENEEINKSKQMMMLASAAAACLSLGMFIAATNLGGGNDVSNNMQESGRKTPSADKFLIKLKEEIKKNGLESQVRASVGSENSIIVAGNLHNSFVKRWMSVLQWYDVQNSPPLLFNNVSENKKNNLPKIKYAWFGENPYAVLYNDDKVSIGDTVVGGWVIEAIDTKGIFMSLADRRVLIKFE